MANGERKASLEIMDEIRKTADGSLDADKNAESMFASVDADKSGEISKEEFMKLCVAIATSTRASKHPHTHLSCRTQVPQD